MRTLLAFTALIALVSCATGSKDGARDVGAGDMGNDRFRWPDIGGADKTVDAPRPDQTIRPDLFVTPDLLIADSAPPDLPPPDSISCSADETLFRGRCYSARQEAAMSYAEAKALCIQHGARVVSISDAVEDQMLFQQVLPSTSRAAFIGLVRQGAAFVWEDGLAATYRNWASGEPNNETGSEDCVVIWGTAVSNASLVSRWNDVPCDSPGRDTVLCVRGN